MTDPAALLATARRASAEDVDSVVETLTLAFAHDPVWRPTLARRPGDQVVMERFWQALVSSTLHYAWIWMLDHTAAVTVWVPPDSIEMPEAEEHSFLDFVRDELGEDRLKVVRAVFEAFGRTRPPQPHFYLSLLATHPDWRGHGLGIGLLRANLELIDTLEQPTYLESSNPSNDARYQSAGYKSILKFELPQGQIVTGMWRDVPSRA